MQRTIWVGVFIGGLLGVVGWLGGRLPVRADEATPNPAAVKNGHQDCQVATIDLSKVLKVERKFVIAMEQLKVDVQAAETALNAERAGIADTETELSKHDMLSGEYRRLSEEVLDRKTAFNLKASKQKARLMEIETAVYAVTYKRIEGCISEYADEHGIRLVLRKNGEKETDTSPRSEVAQNLSRAIVYEKNLDITDAIIQRLNGEADKPAAKDGEEKTQK